MNVVGATWIRLLAVLAGVVAFAYLYGNFFWDTWRAVEDPPTPPTVDPDDVKIATAIAGTLGGLFAVALGVERQRLKKAAGLKGETAPRLLTLATVGATITASNDKRLVLAATLAVWAYFLYGLAAAVTWYFERSVTPEVVKTLAEVMGGYVLALIAALAVSD